MPVSAPRQLRDVEALRRRNEDWRIMHDHGVPNGAGGLVRRTARQIAETTGYTERHVRGGIVAARRLREAVAHAIATAGYQ